MNNITWTTRENLFLEAGKVLNNVDKVLDIGCGIRPQPFFEPKLHICFDPHMEYLSELKKIVENLKYGKGSDNTQFTTLKSNPNSEYLFLHGSWKNALGVFTENSVNTVFLLDVIEHIDKEEGKVLLKATEYIASDQIVLFTPLGFIEQEHEDGVDAWGLNGGDWQKHKSGWLPSDFDSSWKIFACKDFHPADNLGDKYSEPEGAFIAVKNFANAQDSKKKAKHNNVNSHQPSSNSINKNEIQKVIDQFSYPTNYSYDIDSLEPNKKLSKRVGYWKQYAPELFHDCKNFLSVGSSLGFLMMHHGSNSESVTGIEPDRKAVDLCRKVLNYREIADGKVENTTFKGFKKDQKYDLIWMGNVFHYMYLDYKWDVAKVLADISTGYCVVEAPLEGSFLQGQANVNPAWNDDDLMNEYTTERFKEEMNKYFDIIRITPSGTDSENRVLVTMAKRVTEKTINFDHVKTKDLIVRQPYSEIYLTPINEEKLVYKCIHKNEHMVFEKVLKSYNNINKLNNNDDFVKVYDYRVNNGGKDFEVLMEYLDGYKNLTSNYDGNDRLEIVTEALRIHNILFENNLIACDGDIANFMAKDGKVKMIDLDLVVRFSDATKFNLTWFAGRLDRMIEWCPDAEKDVLEFKTRILSLESEINESTNYTPKDEYLATTGYAPRIIKTKIDDSLITAAKEYHEYGKNIIAQSGDLKKAKIAFEEALNIYPEFADVHNSMGFVNWQLELTLDAVDNFRKAVELEPENKTLLLNYCDSLNALGDLGSAFKYVKKYNEVNSGDEEITQILNTINENNMQVVDASPEVIVLEKDEELIELQKRIDEFSYPQNYSYDIETLAPNYQLEKRIDYWKEYAPELFRECKNFLSCGSSLGYLMMYHAGSSDTVTGMEPDREAVDICNKVMQYRKIENGRVDCTTFRGFDKSQKYDLIWAGNVFQYMYLDYQWDVAKHLSELATNYCVIEAPLEGSFLQSQKDINPAWADDDLMRVYTLDKFKEEMNKYFNIVRITPSGTDPINRVLVTMKKK